MNTSEGTPHAGSSRRVLTVPNVISAFRIAMIPVFVALILDEDTTTAGLIVFGVVVATDWVDGTIARRTGQVSDLGKVLDPVADRLAIAAGIIALAFRGVFPVWAAAAILVRDVVVLVVGLVVLTRRHVTIEVRWIGKVATFSLMVAVAGDRLGQRSASPRRRPRPRSAGWRSRWASSSTTWPQWCTRGDVRRAMASR